MPSTSASPFERRIAWGLEAALNRWAPRVRSRRGVIETYVPSDKAWPPGRTIMTTAPAYRQRTVDDVGWRADGRSILWAAIGGMVAAVMIGIPMHMMGMMVMGPAALVGSDNVWVGWVVHIAAGVLFGAPYGLVVHTRGYGKALLYGAIWGLIVGVAFAWFGLFSIVNMPLFSMEGAMDVGMHVMWGAIVGLVAAWGLRRGVDEGTRERAQTRVAP